MPCYFNSRNRFIIHNSLHTELPPYENDFSQGATVYIRNVNCDKGWGLFTKYFIKTDAFVMFYIGEYISTTETERRHCHRKIKVVFRLLSCKVLLLNCNLRVVAILFSQ